VWCRSHPGGDLTARRIEAPTWGEVAGDHRRATAARLAGPVERRDARARAGASPWRLLDLCDDILGHGLHVVLLLTTNEDVGRLHPAVVRPGRCLARVPFERFPHAQAEAWLGAGAQVPRESLPLAELYALREERPADDPRPSNHPHPRTRGPAS
jgi:hypothetical protein